MKNKILIFALIAVITACHNLDLNPLSEGSSENWFSNETEIAMAVNDLYKKDNWVFFEEYDAPDLWTDDVMARTLLSPIVSGSINGETSLVKNLWTNSYNPIARANIIIMNLDESKADMPEVKMKEYRANACFVRACMYSRLISFFGDVVYYDNKLNVDEAFALSRTAKATVVQKIYTDFDYAIENLPVTYGSSTLRRATKGAALAMKARTALYMGDWAIARDAAKACIDLGTYELYPSYSELFLSKTKNTKEEIFGIPRSVELGILIKYCNRYISRNSGGLSQFTPTWDLFLSYLCTDGLPIDESPLFNPREPFEKRDPRCAATVVPFQTKHLGFMYQPHPDSLKVLNFNTGKYQSNADSRGVGQYASYNGLIRKKGVDEDWSDDRITDPTELVMRYADVLLMYAEAKIELGETDQSVRDAINKVRARAYGVNVSQTTEYPAITSTTQAALRKAVRTERRMEFAFEGLRYMDIIRWRLAEKVLTLNNYAMLDPADLRTKVVKKGLWFFPGVPDVDEDGVVDIKPIYDAGLVKLSSLRSFDKSKQYLWPIPSKEILINPNLVQNPGY